MGRIYPPAFRPALGTKQINEMRVGGQTTYSREARMVLPRDFCSSLICFTVEGVGLRMVGALTPAFGCSFKMRHFDYLVPPIITLTPFEAIPTRRGHLLGPSHSVVR